MNPVWTELLRPKRSVFGGALRLVLLATAFGSCACAWAEEAAETRLLKGKEVTEENVVEALTPTPEFATRGLMVRRKPNVSLLITFQTNSVNLTSVARQQLDVVAAALKNSRLAAFDFNIEGHADPRGRPDLNQMLSQQRAESARGYLVTMHGVAQQRLKAEGKGDRELLNPGYPAAPENRRVTFVTITQPTDRK